MTNEEFLDEYAYFKKLFKKVLLILFYLLSIYVAHYLSFRAGQINALQQIIDQAKEQNDNLRNPQSNT